MDSEMSRVLIRLVELLLIVVSVDSVTCLSVPRASFGLIMTDFILVSVPILRIPRLRVAPDSVFLADLLDLVSDGGGVFVLSVSRQSSAFTDLLLPQLRALCIQLSFWESRRTSVDSLRHESPSITERRGAIVFPCAFKTSTPLKIAPCPIPSCTARASSTCLRRAAPPHPSHNRNIVVSVWKWEGD